MSGLSGIVDLPSTQFTTISTAASGATQIVAAVSGKTIRVISLQTIGIGANNVKWQSAANDITGLAYFAANGGYVLPFSIGGWFQTNIGEALNINLSAATAVGGSLSYTVF